ncbi:MAG: DUF2569 family protein [Spirochaetales bacterium]|nr:DUF2569 family protein [Spirochaetales bacterium]
MNLFKNDGLLQSKTLKGVEGLLLLLCINLAILLPLISGIFLYNELSAIKDFSLIFRQTTDIIIAFFLAVSINVFIIVFSLITGLMLWNLNKTGVLLAKILFIIVICFNIYNLIFFLPDNISSGTMRTVVSGIIVPVFWFIYLFMSERVKNTYFRNS